MEKIMNIGLYQILLGLHSQRWPRSDWLLKRGGALQVLPTKLGKKRMADEKHLDAFAAGILGRNAEDFDLRNDVYHIQQLAKKLLDNNIAHQLDTAMARLCDMEIE
jgi:hypothetical protein